MTEAELTQIYLHYGHLVVRRCRRLLRDDPAAAEDASQEVFLRLWRWGDSFGLASSKVAWLYRVADRCCLDRLSRRGRRAEIPLAAAPEPRTGPHQASSLEDGQIVVRFLASFDERLRQVAIYHFVDQLSQSEIAERTGWSRQTINKKISQLRGHASQLRVELEGKREVPS
jgi:RNA polymerase sigma-70 factor (ECF subfamily)